MAAPLLAAAAARVAAGAAVGSATGGAAGSAAAGGAAAGGAGSMSGSAAAAQGGGGAAKLLQQILGKGGGGGGQAANAAGGATGGGNAGGASNGGMGNLLKQLNSGGGQKEVGKDKRSSLENRVDSARRSMPDVFRGGGWGGGPTSNIASQGKAGGIAAGAIGDAAVGAAKIGTKIATGDYAGAALDTVKALVEMPGKLRDMGDAALAAQRGLSQFNGGIAAAFSKLDAQRIGRNITYGKNTEASTKGLAESQSKLEKALMPFQTLGTNWGNRILQFLQEIVTYATIVARNVPGIKEVIDREVAAAKERTMKDAAPIAALMADIAGGSLRGRKFKPLDPDAEGLGGAGARFKRPKP